MKLSENPEPKAARSPRRHKAVEIDSSDISERERRLIAQASKGGQAETTTVRLSPILRDAAAFAMTSRGLTFTEYVNFLVARDTIRTEIEVDAIAYPEESSPVPENALDFVLGTWAGDARRRMANRVLWLSESAFPADQHKLVDALRSFLKSLTAQVAQRIGRERLADEALLEWDAIEATVGSKHIDRKALTECTHRAVQRLSASPDGIGKIEQITAQLRSAGLDEAQIIDGILKVYSSALDEQSKKAGGADQVLAQSGSSPKGRSKR